MGSYVKVIFWVQQPEIKKSTKKLNFRIYQKAEHATHFLKLVDEMCKNEMNPASIVEDT